MKPLLPGTLTAAAILAVSMPAFAHVSFDNARATPNSTYKAVLRIPHGCNGQPTLKVRIRIPEGVIAVKPSPKPGWTLETVKGPYVKAYDLHGSPVAEGVTGIAWTGSLDDGHYDEFVFQARITDMFQPGATVYFPVVQECADGREEWTEIPSGGQDPHGLASPAPGVTIMAASPSAPRPRRPARSASSSPGLAQRLPAPRWRAAMCGSPTPVRRRTGWSADRFRSLAAWSCTRCLSTARSCA